MRVKRVFRWEEERRNISFGYVIIHSFLFHFFCRVAVVWWTNNEKICEPELNENENKAAKFRKWIFFGAVFARLHCCREMLDCGNDHIIFSVEFLDVDVRTKHALNHTNDYFILHFFHRLHHPFQCVGMFRCHAIYFCFITILYWRFQWKWNLLRMRLDKKRRRRRRRRNKNVCIRNRIKTSRTALGQKHIREHVVMLAYEHTNRTSMRRVRVCMYVCSERVAFEWFHWNFEKMRK